MKTMFPPRHIEEHPIPESPSSPRTSACKLRFPVELYAVLGGALTLLLGLYLRFRVVTFRSVDFEYYLNPWFTYLRENGFGGFSEIFSDYNFPYLYLLWFTTLFGNHPMIGIKVISLIFDFVLMLAVYLLARTLNMARISSGTLTLVVFLWPSVWLDSAMWGQCDSIWTAFLVFTLVCNLRGRYILSWFFFGVAVSFKLQAIFLLPVLGILWLANRKEKWFSPFAVLLAPVLAPIPAILAGLPLNEAYSVYYRQTGAFFMSRHFPTFLRWLGKDHEELGRAMIIFVLASVVILCFAVVVRLKKVPSAVTVLVLSATCMVLVPFFLPTIRERYFLAGEILVIVWAAYCGFNRFFLPPLLGVPLIWAYFTSLFTEMPRGLDPGIGSIFVLVAVTVLVMDTFKTVQEQLREDCPVEEIAATPESATQDAAQTTSEDTAILQ